MVVSSSRQARYLLLITIGIAALLYVSAAISGETADAANIISNDCEWECPLADVAIWNQVRHLDYVAEDISTVWIQFQKILNGLAHDLQECMPGRALFQMWAYLHQAQGMGGQRTPLHLALPSSTLVICLPTLFSNPTPGAGQWVFAVLGVLRRVGSELRLAVDSELPLRPCREKVRYHHRGSLDIFEESWIADPLVVAPIHRGVAFLQMAHDRCNIGMSTAFGITGRSLRQLGSRVHINGTTEVVASWLSWELAQVAGLILAYGAVQDPAATLGSDWALFDIMHELVTPPLISQGATLRVGLTTPGGAPPGSVTNAAEFGAPSWLRAESIACTAVWRDRPGWVKAAVIFAKTPVAAALPDAILKAAISEATAPHAAIGSGCELLSVVSSLFFALADGQDGASRAVCDGDLDRNWEFMRGFSGDVFLDPQFSLWGVLVFGLIEQLQALVRLKHGSEGCPGADRRNHFCEPQVAADAFLEAAVQAVSEGRVVSVIATLAFMARSSSLCALPLSIAHFAVTESLVVLAGLGDQRFNLPRQQPMESPGVKQAVVGTLAVETANETANELERALYSVIQQAHTAKTPQIGEYSIFGQAQFNISAFIARILGEDARNLLEEAWVIAAGEHWETVAGTRWPFAALARRTFAALAVLSPWRPVLRGARRQPRRSRVSQVVPVAAPVIKPLPNFGESWPDEAQQWSCPGADFVLDALELVLERAGDAALSDEVYVAAARENLQPSGTHGPAKSKCSPLIQAVGWMYHQHFQADGSQRPRRSVAKFRRRLRLILEAESDSDVARLQEPQRTV